MLETALLVALGCAVISAIARNRTAWVLVPAVAFCLWMQARAVAFDRAFWVAIDAAAIALIYGLNKKLRRADWVILTLFPVAWAFYFLPDPHRYTGTMLVTISQLLLTFPAANVVKRIKRDRERHPDNWDEFDLRAVHEPGG